MTYAAPAERQNAQNLATAVLLVEVTRANPEDTWTSIGGGDVLSDVLDMIDSEVVTYQLVTH